MPPTTVYVYNPIRRVLHVTIDGRSPESCNLDDIRERREMTSYEASALLSRSSLRLCRRCFPDGVL